MSDGYLLACGSSTVAVDFWTAPHAAAFFLTHMHADHYKGLHDDWCQGTIYCSEVTCALLKRKWPLLSSKTIPLDEAVSLKISANETLTVTAIDANHCPGAVMLLFEGACGRVLHSGDFRWEHSIQAELLRHPALLAGPLNLLVLDNTYCHPRYAFPCRLKACQSIISLICAHPDMDIVLGIDSLGKEDLLAAIAHAIGVPIGVAVGRLETVKIAGLPMELFTADMSSTRIRALPKWMVTVELVAKLNRSKATLGIIPTGFACLSSEPNVAAKLSSSNPTAASPAHVCSLLQQQETIADCWQTPIQQQQSSTAEGLAVDMHRQQPGVEHALQASGLLQQDVLCSSNGGQVQQQLPGQRQADSQMSQLFSQANMLEDDLKAYAALVHKQKVNCRADAASAAEIEAALPLLKKMPYSLHNSYSELESFVAQLRPEMIVPIVKKCYDSRYPIDPNAHFKHLLSSLGGSRAPQHRQTHGRRQKRKKQDAVRGQWQAGDEEEDKRLLQHGSWQGVLHSCANAVRQRRLPSETTSQTACSISACQSPNTDHWCDQLERKPSGAAETYEVSKANAYSQCKQEPSGVGHSGGLPDLPVPFARQLSQPQLCESHERQSQQCCAAQDPVKLNRRCIPKGWGKGSKADILSSRNAQLAACKAEENSMQEECLTNTDVYLQHDVDEVVHRSGKAESSGRQVHGQIAVKLPCSAVLSVQADKQPRRAQLQASDADVTADAAECRTGICHGYGLMSIASQICRRNDADVRHPRL